MRRWQFILFSFLLGLSLASCKNDLKDVHNLIPKDRVQVEEIFEFEMLYSDSAVVRVRVSGPEMRRYIDQQNPRQEFSSGVLVEFFDFRGQVTSTLSSKYAIRDEDKSMVIVRDSVVWESVNGERLETSELTWDEKGEKIYTNKFVTIMRPDEIIFGHGFESNQEFTRSRIQAIEGRIRLEDLGTDAF
jgi:LPS export ABC transporter protein LptC